MTKTQLGLWNRGPSKIFCSFRQKTSRKDRSAAFEIVTPLPFDWGRIPKCNTTCILTRPQTWGWPPGLSRQCPWHGGTAHISPPAWKPPDRLARAGGCSWWGTWRPCGRWGAGLPGPPTEHLRNGERAYVLYILWLKQLSKGVGLEPYMSLRTPGGNLLLCTKR